VYGMAMLQIDYSCSISPLARQLVVLTITRTFHLIIDYFRSRKHSISEGDSLILKKARKPVLIPTA